MGAHRIIHTTEVEGLVDRLEKKCETARQFSEECVDRLDATGLLVAEHVRGVWGDALWEVRQLLEGKGR